MAELPSSKTNGPFDYTPYTPEPGEDYMNPRQEAHFREILQTWSRDLREGVDRTVANLQKDASQFPDPNDRASQESDFSLELRARDRERKLIRKIEKSLDAIDQHEYGYCETCGEEIGIRRLEARPTATLCFECKSVQEIEEKRHL